MRDDSAHQREAVGMDAGGGEPQHDVARRDAAAVDHRAALDGANREAREVVVAVGVHARHLGRLAADQRATGLAAAARDARDDGAALCHGQLPRRVVVEEEERLGALDDEVVDAHGDEVDADVVVQPGLDRDLELGPDAIRRRDDQRVREAGGLQVEERPEAAELGVGAAPARRAGQGLDRVDQRLAGVDVDARVPVEDLLPVGRPAARGGVAAHERPLGCARAGLATATGAHLIQKEGLGNARACGQCMAGHPGGNASLPRP
jgi:hypothetical protein